MSRSSPYVKTFFGVLLLLMVAVAVFVYQRIRLRAIDVEISSTAAQIKAAYGVDVHYRYDPKLFFSEDYLLPPVSAKGSQISLRHARGLLPIVENFLSRYPKEVIKKHLSDIYLVGKLEFYGKAYGGTSIESAIYIAIEGILFLRYSDSSLLGAMHEEFSSILFHNYNFPKEEWEATNPPGWIYPSSDQGSGFAILEQKDLYNQTEQLLMDGFLVKRSQSDMENDFNTFADWAFTKPDRLRELVVKYERIRKKYQLVMQFYKSIDPRIDIPSM